MRTLVCLAVALMLLAVIPTERAEAAAQFSIWPSSYSYGTPAAAGTFTWNSTMFGVRLGQPLGPFVSLQTSLKYGSITNLSCTGCSAGATGSTLMADSALQFGLGAGPISLAAYLGYGALVLNSAWSGIPDRAVLVNQATRVGVEATLATSRGLVVRGNYTLLPSLTSSSNTLIAGVQTTQNGNGNGSEYEITLSYTPVPLTTLFAGYRGGTHQITWSGGANTSTTFNGWIVGVEIGF